MLLQWLPWEHDVVPVILYQISVSVFVRGWNELCGDALLSTTKSVSVNLLLVVVVVFSRTFPKRCWGGYKSRLWFLDNLRKLLLVMRFLQMCPIHKRWVKLQLYSRCWSIGIGTGVDWLLRCHVTPSECQGPICLGGTVSHVKTSQAFLPNF